MEKKDRTGQEMHRKAVALGAAALIAMAFPQATLADDVQAGRIAELERKLERSLQMIENLGAKLERIEGARTKGGNPGAPQLADAVQQQSARLETLQQQVSQLGSGLSSQSSIGLGGVPLHGFADVGFTSNNKGARKGFGVGSFDLYLTPQFGDRVKALVELLFEVDEDGSLATDLERAQIGYAFGDAATLWGGRFHTPYGYWNIAFHHGQQIQTSILRPRFLDFEDKGGILPSHLTGAWLAGGTRTGAGKLTYDLYLGNGPKIVTDGTAGAGTLDPNAARDDNHSALVGANIGYQFDAIEGLKIGAHWLRGDVNDDLANRTRLNFYGAYLAHTTNQWENLAEYYRFANRDQSGGTGTHRSWAGFVQSGYYLTERWTPYVRFERTVLDQADNYFAQQASGGSYRRGALGLRFDVDPRAALKAELNRTRDTDRAMEASSEVRVEYSIRF